MVLDTVQTRPVNDIKRSDAPQQQQQQQQQPQQRAAYHSQPNHHQGHGYPEYQGSYQASRYPESSGVQYQQTSNQPPAPRNQPPLQPLQQQQLIPRGVGAQYHYDTRPITNNDGRPFTDPQVNTPQGTMDRQWLNQTRVMGERQPQVWQPKPPDCGPEDAQAVRPVNSNYSELSTDDTVDKYAGMEHEQQQQPDNGKHLPNEKAVGRYHHGGRMISASARSTPIVEGQQAPMSPAEQLLLEDSETNSNSGDHQQGGSGIVQSTRMSALSQGNNSSVMPSSVSQYGSQAIQSRVTVPSSLNSIRMQQRYQQQSAPQPPYQQQQDQQSKPTDGVYQISSPRIAHSGYNTVHAGHWI